MPVTRGTFISDDGTIVATGYYNYEDIRDQVKKEMNKGYWAREKQMSSLFRLKLKSGGNVEFVEKPQGSR